MVNSSMEERIKEEISQLPVSFGVAIKFLEQGKEFYLNEERTYQLASVFKVPVLVTAMKEIESREFYLDQRMEMGKDHKTKPSGILTYFNDGLKPTFEDLLTLMVIISDNTATDMVLDALGGPGFVNETIREVGFEKNEINITMSVHDIFEDVYRFSALTLKGSERIEELEENGVNLEGEIYGENSTANVATPRAINKLYEMIYQGKTLSQASHDKMLDILILQTINEKIPKFLLLETPVAHKTGTLKGVRNDSGIIYVSDNCHVCVTILTRSEKELSLEDFKKKKSEESEKIDEAMGKIGKIIYETGKELT